MMPWLNRLITRGSPFGFTACIGSKSPPDVMICCTFTASIAAHPPMAAADSSINARAASGPDGAGEEQADNSIRKTKAITNINPSLFQTVREDREFFFTGMHFTHDSLNPQSIYASIYACGIYESIHTSRFARLARCPLHHSTHHHTTRSTESGICMTW